MKINLTNLRFKYIGMIESFNIKTPDRLIYYKFVRLDEILSDFLYRRYFKNKILKFYKKYKDCKNKSNLEYIQKQNEMMKNEITELKRQSIINQRLIYDQHIYIKCQNIELSKLIKSKPSESASAQTNDDEYKSVCNYNADYHAVPKLSIHKLKQFFIERGVETKEKSKHQLKQEYNRISNRKYERITDKIIDLKLSRVGIQLDN